MNEEEAIKAIDEFPTRVKAVSFDGNLVVDEGVLVGYSIVPTVTICRDDGTLMHWRVDLVEAVDDGKADQQETGH